jgi:hypothetical protein
MPRDFRLRKYEYDELLATRVLETWKAGPRRPYAAARDVFFGLHYGGRFRDVDGITRRTLRCSIVMAANKKSQTLLLM